MTKYTAGDLITREQFHVFECFEESQSFYVEKSIVAVESSFSL